MKRIGALVCLMIMMVSVLAPASFANEEKKADAASEGFKIESSTPENGAKGVSVENLSVKIYFSKEVLPESSDVKKANAKQFKLTDADGNEIPIKVYYSHKEQKDGLLMVVSDVVDSDIQIQGNTDYILKIGEDLQATDGTTLGTEQTIEFKTLDKSKSTTVYTIMMVVMIAGMIFFSSRSAKKAAEKESDSKGKKPQTVNPYKEAKRTGKSVEEIVAKDQHKKAKQAEALAKQKAKEAELEAELEAEAAARSKAASTKRVSAPKPISAAGSDYKVTVVKTQKPEKKKNSTNPKNQTGKQKNSKNKNKKK